MGKKNELSCLDLPLHEIHQKIYGLCSKFRFVLTEVHIESPRSLQLHIKIVELDTKRFICFDKLTLIELFHQLHQFQHPNINYPCTEGRNVEPFVKLASKPGEYEVTLGKNKLIFNETTVKYLFIWEKAILKNIQEIEHLHLRGGYDQIG